MAEIDPRPPGAAFDAWFCPDCELGVVGVEGEPHLLHCPRCAKYYEIPAEDRVDDALRQGAADREGELNGLRIRQLSLGRRAAYRARSYCVIGVLLCAVAAAQLVWTGYTIVRTSGLGMRPVSYFLFAILAAWGATFFTRKAVELNREAKRSALPTAQAPPDFSTLGDGSDRWKNLEDVR